MRELRGNVRLFVTAPASRYSDGLRVSFAGRLVFVPASLYNCVPGTDIPGRKATMLKPRSGLPAVAIASLALSILCSLPLNAQVFPGNVTGMDITGKSVTVRADTTAVVFRFVAEDVLRVDYLPRSASTPDSSFVVLRDTLTGPLPSVDETDSTINISSGTLTAICSRSPFRISFRSGGKILLSEPLAGGLQADGVSRTAKFVMNAGDHFYGTGERGISLDRRGSAFDSRNEAHYGYTTPLPTMNLNAPFTATSGGYALYFDNTWAGRFDFGSSDPGAFSYTAAGGELTFYLIASPTIPGQLERYTWLTGRQPLPPRWALGFIQSKYGYRNASETQSMASTMRGKNIPCDAVVLDLYWFNQMGDLSWNTSSFPQPETMMSGLRTQGFRTILITEPYIAQTSLNYGTASNGGFAAAGSDSLPYVFNNWWSCGCNAILTDLTNPPAHSWWWSLYPTFMGTGVAGLWTDLGEPERDADDMHFALGPAAKIHNIYNFLWAQTLAEGYAAFRPGDRLFNLTRSGFAGMQRFGVIPWSGDVGKSFGGLAVQIPMMLNMGMSGFAYHNSDIGGFTGYGSGELYTRWMQYGAFCPIMRAHGTGQPTEPWGFGSTVESACRTIIDLRYRLLPYNYTLAHKNYTTGLPLARPLFFAHQDNPSLADESSAYMWGDDLLAAPVVQTSQFSSTINLPAGTWIDYWTDSVYAGGGSATVASPMDRIPLFVRGGSIIPMQGLSQYSDQFPLDTLFLHYYPDPAAPANDTLYEDDGHSLSYQSGAFALTPFHGDLAATSDSSGPVVRIHCTIGASAGLFDGKITTRSNLLFIHTIAYPPKRMLVNNTAVPGCASMADLRAAGRGFFFDDSLHILVIAATGATDSAWTIVADIPAVPTGIHDGPLPKGYRLEAAYPNPFNPTTTITVVLARGEEMKLSVVDILGREIRTLFAGNPGEGRHRYIFDGIGLPAGIYFCILKTGHFSAIRKMVLLK
jgi:alpha-glucosidase (family GH31 glycosyl hydrolase)